MANIMRLGVEFKPEGIATNIPIVTDEQTHKTLFYRSYVTGPQGARYELFRELQHTDEDVKRAKAYIRNNFDAVSIVVINETKPKAKKCTAPNCKCQVQPCQVEDDGERVESEAKAYYCLACGAMFELECVCSENNED